MRKILVLLLIFVAGGFARAQDDAIVTFYSAGSLAKAIGQAELTAGTVVNEPFWGYVFDGDRKISWLRAKHFAAVRVPAGHHVFSASYNANHPAENALLPLDLESGKHYFVALRGTHYGLVIAVKYVGHIEATSCAKAFDQASGFEAVPAKWVDKGWRPKLVNLPYFPTCQ